MVKIKSLFITFIVVLSTLCMGVSTAFAEETTKYWEPRPYCQDSLGCVNDEPADGISTTDNGDGTLTISYDGEGTLTGWDFPTLQENADYEILSRQENSIIIRMLNGDYGLPYINALVDFGNTASEAEIVSAEPQTEEAATQAQTADKDLSQATETALTEADGTNVKNIIYVCIAAVLCVIVVIFIGYKRAH